MGTRRRALSPVSLALFLFLGFLHVARFADANGVFKVQRKFHRGGGGGRMRHSAGDLRAHDARRHSRLLLSSPAAVAAATDLPLGGIGLPTDAGLYYGEIRLGTPSKKYYVQVDTGSDILWVNCASCRTCPEKSTLGIPLTLYDPNSSGTGSVVTCSEKFCTDSFGKLQGCTSKEPCSYRVQYGDGSSTSGYYVTDNVQYNQVSGDHQTTAMNATITFGCGAQQSGDLGSSAAAVDGILGFGQSNTSMISQLAAAGKVKKMFAHCLDTITGGGIFAIGHVVEPKFKTTPLVPNMPHYNVNLKAIQVGGAFLQLPTDLFDNGDKKGTIIDSGTTLSYLPEFAYKAVVGAILSGQVGLSLHTVQDFPCFHYTGSVDDGFPDVVFHFDGSLSLNVYPHDYLFENEDNEFCIGWQNGGVQSKDGKDMLLLGDLALSNKLVVYDLENQVLGWTDYYNCSSSIKIQDDKTGALYNVNAHNLSFGSRLQLGRSMMMLILMIMYCLIG